MAKINKLLAATALCSGLAIFTAQAAEIKTNMARMQAMDKITGKVSEIDVPVDGEVTFGTFSIVVRYCATRSPEETPENFAFVDVVDNYNSSNPVNVFKGWMLSSTPALNAVEHPIYDVWLLNCYNGDTKEMKLLKAEDLKARDEIAKVQPKTELSTEARKALEQEEKNKVAAVAEAQKEVLSLQEAVSQEIENKPQTINEAAPAEAMAEVIIENTDPNAPKLLINLRPQPPVAPAETENSIEDSLKLEETIFSETIPTHNTTFEQPQAEAEAEVATEPVVAPAEESLLIPVTPEAETTPEEAVPDQLIHFDEEAEEDGFEINADALIN